MSKVLYISWSGLPETAAGIRVYQIAKVLREAGNEVIFLSLSQPTAGKQDEIEYDGFHYILKGQSKSKIKMWIIVSELWIPSWIISYPSVLSLQHTTNPTAVRM